LKDAIILQITAIFAAGKTIRGPFVLRGK